jgi:bifunctional non-homologous end joining protein LigD
MGLNAYRSKRKFSETGEPKGRIGKSPSGKMFIVQKHAARRLHYDLRLEANGVLKSWAVPKGPSYDPAEKRLAVQVEDHPIEYGDFEGQIEENQYGAGTVMVWDRGTWMPVGDWKKDLPSGKLKFRLNGQKLKGLWTLVRFKGREEKDSKNWLLIKHLDQEARKYRQIDVTREKPLSVKTKRSLEEIREQSTGSHGSTGKFDPSATKRTAPKKTIKKAAPYLPPGKGRKAPWPDTFYPQLATPMSRLPEGNQWLYEIKFDGYRLLGQIRKGRVRLKTRRGQDWTEKFPLIAEELSRLPVKNGILDGEVVVQNRDGTTSFQDLQNILRRKRSGPLLYYVFDLPYLDDHDLSAMPLIERKTLLRELIQTNQRQIPSIRYSDHLADSGKRVFQMACQHAMEGIIAKRADSPYVQHRSHDWAKAKCLMRQEFVVGGYTEPKGSRSFFGSLLLGYYDDRHRLVYCGHVGTGFNEVSLKTIYPRLKKLEQDHSPFASEVEKSLRRNVHWVSPRIIADVEFSSRTHTGTLRHPSFMGIREDKEPGEVTLEKEIPPPDEAPPRLKVTKSFPIRFSHPDKVLYPEEGVTKKDIGEYYMQISKWILPELTGRPLVLVRCPEGLQGDCFFQKHLEKHAPKWIQTVPIKEKKETTVYPVVEDLKGLLSLVQLDVLEIHAWGCRRDHLEFPDRMIFDLDPSPEISKKKLIEATLFFKDWLLKKEIKSFLKTTGGKGIHVVIPLNQSLGWKEVEEISRSITLEMARRKPDWFIATMRKQKRKGKIFLDYFRNKRGATSILPYSTRARPGAPVALPISDKELTEDFLSHPPNVTQTIEQLKKMKRDPWQGMHEVPWDFHVQ